jgi:hypothetical protein
LPGALGETNCTGKNHKKSCMFLLGSRSGNSMFDSPQPQQLIKTTQNVHRKLGKSVRCDWAASTQQTDLLMLHKLALVCKNMINIFYIFLLI